MTPAALLTLYPALGPRRLATLWETTPERVIALHRQALRRTPRHRRVPIAKAFAIYEMRNDFTAECLADMLALPAPAVRARLELLGAA